MHISWQIRLLCRFNYNQFIDNYKMVACNDFVVSLDAVGRRATELVRDVYKLPRGFYLYRARVRYVIRDFDPSSFVWLPVGSGSTQHRI